ncbi:MAG: hypothetical protein NT105_05120 [Verrucomicrobia bacterium]|nr:hypothetical protein [Verrucomicrobiota bacterium]
MVLSRQAAPLRRLLKVIPPKSARATQSELQAVVNKIDELIQALKRWATSLRPIFASARAKTIVTT